MLEEILGAGPMASFVSQAKAAALVSGDFVSQAAIPDVLKNARLTVESAREHRVDATLMNACAALYAATLDLEHAGEDMAAVIAAYRVRTVGLRG